VREVNPVKQVSSGQSDDLGVDGFSLAAALGAGFDSSDLEDELEVFLA
jgi:hypothetical protein